jgi:hypothetical protein
LPTKTGLKLKLRGDLWTGPYKIIGKLPNGNLKLNIFKKMDVDRKSPYITHPDRLKPAEEEYLAEPFRYIKSSNQVTKKSVRFDENLVVYEAKNTIKKMVTFADEIKYIL